MPLDPKGLYGIKITVGTANRYLAFRAPKAVYETLATSLGLEKIDSPAEASKAMVVAAAHYCRRVRVTYKSTTSKSGTASGSLWVAPDKIEEVLDGLTGQYRSQDIVRVSQPLDTNRA